VTDHADSIDSAAGPNGFDSAEPNVARIYDYLLGGKDNFAADRRAAERLLAELPNAAAVAKANRAFLTAAVRRVARAGVRQYVDIGAGLPTSPSVHECAREVVPAARVAYVDNDPIAVAHARALLATGDGLIAIEGDARRPEAILADPGLAELIDLAEPVCVLLVSMLHFLTADEADAIVDAVRRRVAPGSYLVISAGDADDADVDVDKGVRAAYGRRAVLTGRPAAEIAAYFDGFDLLPPGLVSVTEWAAAQPGEPAEPNEPLARPPVPHPAGFPSARASMLAGVGRKRGATS
jgi:SAM-dependent methyltransferase